MNFTWSTLILVTLSLLSVKILFFFSELIGVCELDFFIVGYIFILNGGLVSNFMKQDQNSQKLTPKNDILEEI